MMEDTRDKWLRYFTVNSENCEQRHLTADTHGIVLEFVAQERDRAVQEALLEVNETGAYDFKNGSQMSFGECEWVSRKVREALDEVEKAMDDSGWPYMSQSEKDSKKVYSVGRRISQLREGTTNG